jgi:hypothetical protein
VNIDRNRYVDAARENIVRGRGLVSQAEPGRVEEFH